MLLQRRSDDGEWGLPGGAMEPGEEPAESLVREVREETALEVVPERIVGVYSGPDFRVSYANGDQAMIVSITFACRSLGGEPRINDDESLELATSRPTPCPRWSRGTGCGSRTPSAAIRTPASPLSGALSPSAALRRRA